MDRRGRYYLAGLQYAQDRIVTRQSHAKGEFRLAAGAMHLWVVDFLHAAIKRKFIVATPRQFAHKGLAIAAIASPECRSSPPAAPQLPAIDGLQTTRQGLEPEVSLLSPVEQMGIC